MDSKRLIFLTAVIAVVSGIATTDGNSRGAACVFPFLYKGQQYSQCITADRNIPWCATTDNYDTDGRWGKCPGYNCTELTVADIVFLVDQSQSVTPLNFPIMLEFLHNVVDSFDVAPDHVRIGMALYSTEPTNEFKLNTYQNKEDILKHIDKMSYRGGYTLTGEALKFILENHFVESAGSRAKDKVPQIAVVITDGKSHDDVEPSAKKLRDQGITIYAIGVKDADQEELKQIASAPQDKHVFSVSDFKALKGIYQNVVQVVCTQTDPCVAKNCREKEKCVKNGSTVQCVAESSATCWTIGDPHYKSFDGKLFSYQGSCTYPLVQTTGLDDTLTPFSIVIKTEMESKGRGAYLKTVTISMEDVKIVVMYGDPGKVLINGTTSTLPVTLKSGRIRMTKESYKGVLKTDFGVEIIFDWGETLHVTVPSSYYKNLEGMCGTYNGDESDDFSTPDGC